MSLNVLIIAEDYRLDQYVLKPILRSMLREVGKPNANVQMCREPMISGYTQALDADVIEDVILTNPLVDLYVLAVDRDGDDGDKSGQLRARETGAQPLLRDDQCLLGEQAHQEVEVWLLAGQNNLPGEWNWRDVRDEPNAKEVYYDDYVEQKGLRSSPGKGRKRLGTIAGANYRNRVRVKCDEVHDLESRVAQVV
jgi:hypothetical protein